MILVVGATGELGGMITRDLLSRGHTVRVLVRPGSEYGPLLELGAQAVMGDLRDPQSLARACADVTTVITTANSAGRGGGDTPESVDRVGNRSLIDAARAAGVDHFVFVSALGASEQSPVDFFRAKAETERHLVESGMAWTVLQPNIFMEVWIGMLVLMPVQQGRPVTLVGRGDHRHAMISMGDVAAFAVASVTHPAARNTMLVLGGPQAHTWTDVVRLAELVLGRAVELRYVPPGEALPGLPPVASQLAAQFETYETVIDTSAASATFGVPLTSVEAFLRRSLHPVDA
ncbi:MAG TPA: SDR family oxidoreductase [Longimicrobiales bacterium]|nr:SDR family oxidoreductase [Longimicrobiales bacterium]